MLRLDLVAGLTVSLVSLPLAMAFAAAAGLGPDVGLVTAIVAGAVAAIFGGSELNITGPAGSLIGVLAGVLIANQIGGYQDVLALGLIGGTILILLGLSGLGGLVRLVPLPVIIGFTGGIGIIIFVSQLEDAMGLPRLAKSPNFHENLGAVFGAIDNLTFAAVGVTILTIALIEGIGRVLPKAFAPLLGIIGAALVVWAFGLEVLTLEDKYGAIPRSLPTPAIPALSLDQITRLFPAALTMAALCALESLLSASASDAIAGKRHNSNAELIGCGIANMASPLFGGIPACGAIARTTLNARSGAQTRIAGVFNALALLLIMLFMAPIVGRVPTAALAGLLILIAIKMVDVGAYRRLFVNHHWTDFTMMATTLLATVFVSLVAGITLGLSVALLAYFKRAHGAKSTADSARNREVTGSTKVAVASVGGPLFFHTARRVLEEATAHTPDVALVLCLRDTEVIDASGIQALKDVLRSHHGEKRRVYLSGVSDSQRDLLERTGVIDIVGDGLVFARRDAALLAAHAE
ncbi:MAG: SulP family inorganic anion transporter [Nannocystaceae bacterium]|nr:SulP family inorganic anion transporter [Nannocystaceae bacterium]